MINSFHFDGRLTETPTLEQPKDKKLTSFVLIQNKKYGDKEWTVRVRFTAFEGIAETITKHCLVGDQLMINAELRNNDYTDQDDKKHYDMDFLVVDFSFGAPGPAKRKQLEESREPQATPAAAAGSKRRRA